MPMIVLPTNGLLPGRATLIWVIFVLGSALRFTLVPRKLPFLVHKLLTLVSPCAPSLCAAAGASGEGSTLPAARPG